MTAAGLEEDVAPADHGLDRDDVRVDEPQRHGVLVDHVVEQVASRAALVEAPAVSFGSEGSLELRVGLAYDSADAHPDGPADGPVGDQLLGLLERGIVHEALAHPEGQPGILGHLSELEGLVDGIGDGLLHRDVLARSQRGAHMSVVEVRRGQDLHGVDVVVGEEGVHVRVDPGHLPALGRLTGDRFVDVAHRQHVAMRVLQITRHIHVGDVPRTENAETDRVRRRALPHQSLPLRDGAVGPAITRPRMYPVCRWRVLYGVGSSDGREPRPGEAGIESAPPTVSYAAAALVYERLSASSTKRFTAADQKNPTCPPG